MADKKPFKWRPILRALHRDVGYLCVGFTIIYALSGLAVNHAEDWDPSFKHFDREVALDGTLPEDEQAAARMVQAQLGIDDDPIDVFGTGDELELLFEDGREIFVDVDGVIHDRGKEDRFFLRIANWLHVARGKKAWLIFADGYSVFLIFLALSGLFMIKGKKGIWVRGAIVAGIGLALPILYVALSGGP